MRTLLVILLALSFESGFATEKAKKETTAKPAEKTQKIDPAMAKKAQKFEPMKVPETEVPKDVKDCQCKDGDRQFTYVCQNSYSCTQSCMAAATQAQAKHNCYEACKTCAK